MQHFTIFIGILYTAKHVEKSATATSRKRKQSSEEEQGRNKPYKILQCHHVIQECIIKKEGRKRYILSNSWCSDSRIFTCTIIDLPVICPPTKYVALFYSKRAKCTSKANFEILPLLYQLSILITCGRFCLFLHKKWSYNTLFLLPFLLSTLVWSGPLLDLHCYTFICTVFSVTGVLKKRCLSDGKLH